MPYARLDDCYDDNEKIQAALHQAPGAIVLHVLAITYCNRHNSDGQLPGRRVDSWLRAMPFKPVTKERILSTLLDLRLLIFEPTTNQYHVHDYLDWNRSRTQREALSQQGRRGGLAKAKAKPKPRLDDGLSTPVQRQDNTTPVQQTIKEGGSRTVDQDALPANLSADLHDPAKEAVQVLTDVHGERGGNEPTLRGVGLAIARYPDRDHLNVARELEHWALAGRGQAKPVVDWARTYATFLRQAVPGSPVQTGKVMSLRRQGSNDEPLSKETAARIRARQKELEELAERDSTATGEGQ